MADLKWPPTVTEAIKADAERRRLAQAEAFVASMDMGEDAPQPSPASPAPVVQQPTPQQPTPQQPTAPAYGREPDPVTSPGQPAPAYSGDLSDASSGDLIYDAIDQFGAGEFFDLPLSSAMQVLEMDQQRIDPAEHNAWADMAPMDRAGVIDALAETPGLSLGDAMRQVLTPPAADSIEGGQGDDTIIDLDMGGPPKGADLPWWQQGLGAPKGEKPPFPTEPTDAALEKYVLDTLGWIGEDLPDVSLDQTLQALDFADQPSQASKDIWDTMTVEGRFEVFNRLMNDYTLTIDDVMRSFGPQAEDVQEVADDLSRRQAVVDEKGREAVLDLRLPFVMFDLDPDGWGELNGDMIDAWDAMDMDQRGVVLDRMLTDPGITWSDAVLGGDGSDVPPTGEDTTDGGDGTDTLAEADQPGLLRRFLSDVGRGIGESGTQIIGGVADGIFAMGAGYDQLRSPADYLTEVDPETGQVRITQIRTAQDREAIQRAAYEANIRPRDASTITGGMVRGVAQFLTGFVAGGKALKSVKGFSQMGRAKQAMTQAALADFAAFDGHEARLSDLIQEFPALQNPVTEYLASDMTDSELEGRLKNVAEGALSDIVLAGLGSTLSVMREARRIKEAGGLKSYAEAAKRRAADTRAGENVLPEAGGLDIPPAPMLTIPGVTPGPSIDDLVLDARQRGEWRKAEVKRLTADDAAVTMLAQDRRAVVAPAPDGGEGWQVTTFDAAGKPTGTIDAPDKAAALTRAMEDGWRASDSVIGTQTRQKPLSTVGQNRSPRALGKEIQTYLQQVREGAPEGTGTVPPELANDLAALRAGKGSKAPKGRPAARALQGQGGIDPSGPFAAELRARGITVKTHPGLFRKGGLKSADNLTLADFEIFNGRPELDDGTGYVPEQAWIDALEDEARGDPWVDLTAPVDADTARLDGLSQYLDELGLDVDARTDAEIIRAMEADAKARLDDEALDAIDSQQPRTEADLEAELAQMAKDGNPHVWEIDQNGKKVYVNAGRIASEHDVRALIQRIADMGSDEVDEARRGIRSNQLTEEAADKENAWEVLLERRKGQALNAEQTLAIRKLWTASGERLAEAARAVAKRPTPENSFLFRRAMALHGTIQREVIAARTETARALQQWAIPAGSNEFVAKQMADMVTQFGDVDVSRQFAKDLLEMVERGERGAADQFVRRGVLAATFDAVATHWTQAILTGPKTHMVNVGSNSAVVALLQIERGLAAQIGAIRGGVDRVEAGEATAMLHASLSTLPEAFRLAARALRTGESGYGIGKVELPRQRAISTEMLGNTTWDFGNKVVNTPLISHGINAWGAVMEAFSTRPLAAGDEFFKTINYRMELHAQAFRTATQEARTGAIKPADVQTRMAEILAEPSDELMGQARDFAQYGTFTNRPGKVAQSIQKMRHIAPFPMRFIVPFINTPANILRFLTERSPAAPLLEDFRADIAAGGARADTALARMGLGSMVMLTAYDAAMNGRITGSGPSKKSERDTLYRMGWMPNAIRVGDRFFAYNRLDPFGGMLGIAANLAEMSLNSDIDPGEDYDEAVYGAIGAVGQMVMDKAYLQGISDLFSALSEPKRFAPAYFENLAASFVPAIVREAEAMMSPEMSAASNTVEKLKSRIPAMSDDVPTRHDLWGREVDFQSGLGAVYDAVSPIYSSQLEAEPIDQELMQIGYFPGMPSKRVTVDGEAFVLRNEPEAYERYLVLQGATPASALPTSTTSTGKLTAGSRRLQEHGDRSLREALNDMVTDQHPAYPEFSALPTDEKIKRIEQTIGDYRAAAKDKLLTEFPDIFDPGSGKVRGGEASSFAPFVEVAQ